MYSCSILLWVLVLISQCSCSEFGVSLGDSATSQLMRYAATQFLEETRVADILLKSRESPTFGSLADVKWVNVVSFRNASVNFQPKFVNVFFDKVHILSHINISDVLWPIPFSDSVLDSNVIIPRGHLRFSVDDKKMKLANCALFNPSFSFHLRDSWIINQGLSAIGYLMETPLQGSICTLLASKVDELLKDSESKVPLYNYLPRKIQNHMSARNTTLFYRVNSIEAEEHQLNVKAQIEWQTWTKSDESTELLSSNDGQENSTKVLTMEMRNGEMLTVWLEDGILNEILEQIEWKFEWMDEQVPLSSPIIPPDSRDFLSTLCTECYFQVNVNANGTPSIEATNSSLVLTKTDHIHLRVVNPDRNVTSVFVSLELTIQASLTPSIENGTLRTGVELLDTKIEMHKGAFPQAWRLFMNDLIRGMIMDMMWPEMKSAIEELTNGKGLKLSKYCGFDPNKLDIDIGEGSFSVSTRLMLPSYNAETCLKDLKASIPKTPKLFLKTNTETRSF